MASPAAHLGAGREMIAAADPLRRRPGAVPGPAGPAAAPDPQAGHRHLRHPDRADHGAVPGGDRERSGWSWSARASSWRWRRRWCASRRRCSSRAGGGGRTRTRARTWCGACWSTSTSARPRACWSGGAGARALHAKGYVPPRPPPPGRGAAGDGVGGGVGRGLGSRRGCPRRSRLLPVRGRPVKIEEKIEHVLAALEKVRGWSSPRWWRRGARGCTR
jgi:hypothetical protein